MMPARPTRGATTGLLGLLVCLLVVAALVWSTPPTAADRELPTAAPGDGTGAWIELAGDIDVRFDGVELARAVSRPDRTDPVLARDGAVLVVVRWRARISGEPQLLRTELRIGDRRYDERPEFASDGYQQTQPGFTATQSAVYEIPVDLAGAATMVVREPQATLATYDRLVVLRTDLAEQPVEPLLAIPPATTEVTR